MIIIAQRGASGYEPENTCNAYKKALEMGADAIEIDARRCKSGEIVVICDAKVDRTTNGRGYVSQKTLAELKVLNAGKGEKILTLQEALECIGKNTPVMVHIKETSVIDMTTDIIHRYIEKGWKKNNFVIASTKSFKLQRIREKYPYLKISPIIVFFPKIFTRIFHSMQPFSLHVDKQFLSKDFVRYAHKYNIHIFAWPVNDRRNIEKMKELGVDGIITGFPDKARKLVGGS